MLQVSVILCGFFAVVGQGVCLVFGLGGFFGRGQGDFSYIFRFVQGFGEVLWFFVFFRLFGGNKVQSCLRLEEVLVSFIVEKRGQRELGFFGGLGYFVRSFGEFIWQGASGVGRSGGQRVQYFYSVAGFTVSAQVFRIFAWFFFRQRSFILMVILLQSQNSKKKFTGVSLLLVIEESLLIIQYLFVEFGGRQFVIVRFGFVFYLVIRVLDRGRGSFYLFGFFVYVGWVFIFSYWCRILGV